MSPKIAFRIAFVLFLAAAVEALAGARSAWMPVCAVGGAVALAFGVSRHPRLKSFAFTAWVFAFVVAALVFPAAFGTWFGFRLDALIIPLIQVIMFGMGTTLSPADFRRIAVMPWPVFIGLVLQFAIMPLSGFAVGTLLGFEPEVAAGIILIGSVPGGVASNVINYLAGGSVALSVTMTAVGTLLSPVMTPLMMKALAGRLVPIDFVSMMISILNMTIFPVLAGLVANGILYGKAAWTEKARALAGAAAAGIAAAAGLFLLWPHPAPSLAPLRNGLAVGAVLVAIVTLIKIAARQGGKRGSEWMDKALPAISMGGICVIIAIITAQSRDQLLRVAPLLLAAVVIHNGVGYLLGYWGARAARLNERDSRTVAIEVGIQNGGMATGIAMTVLKSPAAALAPAIFGPYMNVSGSILANWWRRRPADAMDRARAERRARKEPVAPA